MILKTIILRYKKTIQCLFNQKTFRCSSRALGKATGTNLKTDTQLMENVKELHKNLKYVLTVFKKITLICKVTCLFYLFFYLHYHTLGTNDTITYKVSSSDSFYRFQADEGGKKTNIHICKIQYIPSFYSLCR